MTKIMIDCGVTLEFTAPDNQTATGMFRKCESILKTLAGDSERSEAIFDEFIDQTLREVALGSKSPGMGAFLQLGNICEAAQVFLRSEMKENRNDKTYQAMTDLLSSIRRVTESMTSKTTFSSCKDSLIQELHDTFCAFHRRMDTSGIA